MGRFKRPRLGPVVCCWVLTISLSLSPLPSILFLLSPSLILLAMLDLIVTSLHSFPLIISVSSFKRSTGYMMCVFNQKKEKVLIIQFIYSSLARDWLIREEWEALSSCFTLLSPSFNFLHPSILPSFFRLSFHFLLNTSWFLLTSFISLLHSSHLVIETH